MRRIGIGAATFCFAIILSVFSITFITNSNAGNSISVLPFSKGGTNANNAVQARINLKMMNPISQNSTDDEIPNAKEVYAFRKPLISGIVSLSCFDAYYEKYPDKIVKITFLGTVKQGVTIGSSCGGELPIQIKADVRYAQYVSTSIDFFSSSNTKLGYGVMFLTCGGGDAGTNCHRFQFGLSSGITNATHIMSKPIFYTAI
jgi:hypothetical protein